MKNKFLNILIIFITFTIIMQITAVVSATDLSATEKKNIEDFLKKEENLMFSSTYYSNVYELPILDSFNIAWLIATNKGTLVDGNTQLSESEFNEVDKITNGFKAYSFTKKDADEFLKSKIGINFNELKEYKEYESKHTISTSKEIYYEVVEGGEPGIYEIDKIESIKKMENGNIEVEVVLGEDKLNSIVTLKPNGDSYLFVSNKKSSSNDTQKQKIQKFLNEEENLIFSYHNYSKASEIPLTDEWGIPETITLKYGKIIEDDSPEISKIVGEFKAYYFTKDDADKFLMEKMGIKFSDLNDYKTYEETHTTSSNKKVYYQITEGYGTEPIEYKVEELETLENGNIKVKISYKNGLINIVTLKPNGDSYLFVSCVNNDPEYKLLYNRETINKETKEDNTIAKKSIPQTGIRENIIIFSTIMIIGIMVIVILIKNNKLKDI